MPQLRLHMVVGDNAFGFDGDIAFVELQWLVTQWFEAIRKDDSNTQAAITALAAKLKLSTDALKSAVDSSTPK